MFIFKVTRKRFYTPGVLVIGKVLSGEISNDESVIVCVNQNTWIARVDAINSNYPNGEKIHSCSEGENVGLFLSKIDYKDIFIGKTTITSVVEGKEEQMKGDDLVVMERSQKENRAVKESQPSCDNYFNSANNFNDIVQQGEMQGVNDDQTNAKSEQKIKRRTKTTSNPPKTVLCSQEKEYTADITKCLKENGCISPTELFVLDKIRKSLNISDYRSHELLEITVMNYSMKKNLNIYRDAVAACLLDCGYLTHTERFLLERLRMILNIPDSLAFQLEREIDWGLPESLNCC